MKKIFNKKFLSAIAVLAISGSVAMGAAACDTGNNGGDDVIVGKTYYVSADGTGDGKSINSPAPITILNTAVPEKISAGDTVYLLPGTYEWSTAWKTHDRAGSGIIITANGLPNGNIKIINAALDENSGYTGTETKVTLDFSGMSFDGNNRGVSLSGNYIYWYGIDICGAGDNGMYIGGSYNTVEYCEFYNNRDTGLQLGRSSGDYSSVNDWPSFNLIKNCTSHNNYDDETYGENADGFAAKLTIGYGNVFDGCIAYRNSDDGWDLYAKSDSGNIGCVIIYNCVAFENGYLEYTQAENHARLNFNNNYSEPNTNSYKTRDGDGNGFKLGGSVMEGDVKMYNCLAFQNRMHGVTDNSNPGYLQIDGVTSYDNSAAIDDNPESDTFGQVVSIANHETHANVDVARQTYSYNTVKNTLSVKSGMAKSLESDAYRGSVMNSLLNADKKTNVIKGSLDADTKIGSAKKEYTEQVTSLVAEDVFKQLPVVIGTGDNGTTYTHNIDGARDSDQAVAQRVHDKYRNEDHSINMGDLLAVKDDFDFSTYFGAGVKAGSVLNKSDWDAYTHFADPDLLNGVKDEVTARLLKAKETLTINSDEEAVYQDFEVPTQLMGCKVNWTSDSEYITIGKLTEISVSSSEYITIGVERPTSADATVTLTASISYHNHSINKDFVLNLKKDEPSIGGLQVRVSETDEVYEDNGKIIIDAYRQYSEPVLEVQNGAYYNGTLLKESQYTVETVYEYAASTKDSYVQVASFMPNHAGVYKITHNVTLTGGDESGSITYYIFVASVSANVDFDGGASVSVYRDGYIIAGTLTNVTGTLYTVASATELTDLTVENIKTYEGVESNSFRATDISFGYENANSGAYYIYYALANANGDITSELYSVEISKVDISSEADFMKIAGGSKIGSEVVSQTIYLLTDDLDFSETTWSASSSAFTGLLNGQGHTISNVTVSASGNASLFSQVNGGTIENIKFNNIKITSTGSRAGIIARSYGGYYHNLAITNLYVSGTERVGGLIGQAFEGATPTEISQISLINPIPVLKADGTIDTTAEENEGQLYYITGSSNRVAGIIGYIQTNSTLTGGLTIKVFDCYVDSYIQQTGGYAVSAIIGQYDENGKYALAQLNGYDFSVEITSCISSGVLYNNGTGRMGGMVGYQSGVGPLRVYGCIALHEEYYKGALIETAQKNQSGIIGGSTAADVIGCVALMEEYNTDYDVSAQLPINLKYVSRIRELGLLDYFDTESKWSLNYDESYSDHSMLNAPYFTLNFLGEWN
ncbi:MAG: hypothetical protein J1G05_01940 [Clostridiales bacterium]|nr:hypothetical protein [Clostridiales bacterium]